MDLKQNPLKTDSSANTIYIEWRREPGHFHNYIIKYRAKDSNDVLAMQTTPESKIQLSNLKTSTSYEIKIFVEDTDGDESLLFKTEVRTVASIASELLKSAEKICNDPITYRLRPVKITKPFENILIHEFFSEGNNEQEKSLLLLGSSGSGKSTLVNALINYVTDVSFADNFRFKITDEKPGNARVESLNCYKIRCQDGFKVRFNLNIIDVPGFDSTFNESIYRQLITLLRTVSNIGAACLVVPSFCRLTYEHRLIFNNILSIFGNDIGYVIPLITFHDGGEITALNSLTELKVPFLEHMHFTFNNSQLLSGNDHVEFWNARQNTMTQLFGEPTVFQNFSTKKTKKVLESRISLNQSLQIAETLRLQVENREKSIQDYELKNSKQHRIPTRKKLDSDADKICINCNLCNHTCVSDCSRKVSFFWYFVIFLESIWSFICCICCCLKCCSRICRCSCKRSYCCRIKCLQQFIGCKCSCSFAHHVKEYGRFRDKRILSENANDIEDQNVFKIENTCEMQQMQDELQKLKNEFKKNYSDILKYVECIKATALIVDLPEGIEDLRVYQERLLSKN